MSYRKGELVCRSSSSEGKLGVRTFSKMEVQVSETLVRGRFQDILVGMGEWLLVTYSEGGEGA